MKKYRLKKKPFILLIFCVSILFLFTFNFTSSRYMGQLSGEVDDIVAVPILNLENPIFNNTIENMLPGDIKEADFYVTNYDDEKNNEVLMKYYLNVRLDSEIPIKVILTDENGKELSLNEGKTDEYEIPYKTKTKVKYHIKLEWDEKDNSYDYASKDIKLMIDLTALQVVEG